MSDTAIRPRGPRQRCPPRHRADAARAVGGHRRLAHARLAPRARRRTPASRTSSSTCSSRARRRASPRTSRSRSTRSAASSTPSRRRNTPATTSRCSTSTCRSPSTSSPISISQPAVRRRRHRAREEGRSSKRSRWSRTRPTISSTRSSPKGFWGGHPLGRPILGTPATRVGARSRRRCSDYFADTYVAANFVVVAVGNLEHERVQALLERALADAAAHGRRSPSSPRRSSRRAIQVRAEGPRAEPRRASARAALPQHHPDRYAGYALNTTLGGSMSSRLFQNVREKRGLAYAVFSGLSRLSGRRRAQHLCRLRQRRRRRADRRRRRRDPADEGGRRSTPVELRRAKDHLKGSLMLGLESTSSRMSHLARQEMYRDRTDGLDEMLAAIERVTAEDVSAAGGSVLRQRLAWPSRCSAT